MGYFDHFENRFNLVVTIIVVGSFLIGFPVKRKNELKSFPNSRVKKEELEKLNIYIILGGVFLALGIAAIIYFMFTPIKY